MLSLDKENTNGGPGRIKLVSDTGGPSTCGPTSLIAQQQQQPSFILSTPNNSTKQKMTSGNTTGKRRALGDVINTANRQGLGSIMTSVTPKVERSTVGNKNIGGELSIKPPAFKRLVDATPRAVDSFEDELEPIERYNFLKESLSQPVCCILDTSILFSDSSTQIMTHLTTYFQKVV